MEIKWPGEELILKMWETLAEKGVGGLLKPWQAGREGKAHAEVRRHEILALAQAEVDAAEVKAGRKRFSSDGKLVPVLPGTREGILLIPANGGRIEPTFNLEEAMRTVTANSAATAMQAEINVARTVLFAEESLAQENQTTPQQSIDGDWLSNWREYVERVSSEDLQRLWASVLAGEVKAPGTFSLRTLALLRTLSKKEAEEISQLAAFVIAEKIVREGNISNVLAQQGISFDFLLRMQELGILGGVEAVGIRTTFGSYADNRYERPLRCNDKVLGVKRDGHEKLSLEVYSLTTIGTEIMKLGNFSANEEYLIELGKLIAAKGFVVVLGDLVTTPSGFGYTNGRLITP